MCLGKPYNNDDYTPYSSIISPHQVYFYPKAGVCIYVKPIGQMFGYLDVQIGDLMYVLEYDCGISPENL